MDGSVELDAGFELDNQSMEEMKRSSIDFEEPKNSKSSSSRTHDAKASSSRRVESDGENPREDMEVEKQSQSITGEGKMKFGKDIETWFLRLGHLSAKPSTYTNAQWAVWFGLLIV